MITYFIIIVDFFKNSRSGIEIKYKLLRKLLHLKKRRKTTKRQELLLIRGAKILTPYMKRLSLNLEVSIEQD